MPSLVTVTNGSSGDEIVAEHINQLVELLQGLRNIPSSLTGINDSSNYALTIKNAGTGGRGLNILNSAGAQLFAVSDSGLVLPTGSIGTASIADGSITPVKMAATAFTAWTPALTQGGSSPTSTNSASTYQSLGKQVIVTLNITVTSAGSAGNDIQISTLPVAPKYISGGYPVLGTFTLVRVGLAIYVGNVAAQNASTVRLVSSANTGGFLGNVNGPSFALANTDIISFALSYEAA